MSGMSWLFFNKILYVKMLLLSMFLVHTRAECLGLYSVGEDSSFGCH